MKKKTELFKTFIINYFCWYFFYWSIQLTYNIILVLSIPECFDIYILYEIITTMSLVTICHIIKLLQFCWLYSLRCTLQPQDWFILRLEVLNPFCHLSLPPPPSPLATSSFFAVSMSLFLFGVYCYSLVLVFRSHM